MRASRAERGDRAPVRAVDHGEPPLVDPGAPTGRPGVPPANHSALLEHLPVVAYVAGFGDTAAWSYVSPRIQTLLGFTPEEWMADPTLWSRQIHPDDRERVLSEEATSLERTGRLISEYRLMTRYGHPVWVRDEAILVTDDRGLPVHWEGVIVDIGDRKAAEAARRESESRYSSLFQSVPVGLYRTGPDGNLIDVNASLADTLGFASPAVMLSTPAHEFYVDPGDRELWKERIDREGILHNFEMKLRRRDGKEIWVRDSARGVRDADGNVTHYEGALQEITAERRAIDAVRVARERLERTVKELEHRNREMELIGEMADLLQSCPTTDEAYNVIAHFAQDLFAGDAGGLFVIGASRNLLDGVAVWGEPKLGERVFGPDDCWALRRGRIHASLSPDSRVRCSHLTEELPGASLCIPMMAQGESLGIVHIQERPGRSWAVLGDGSLEPKHQLATAVAEHVGLALANLKLRDTLRTQSIRDPLTGLFNRRYMEESLERELRRAIRQERPLTVMMVDLDHFTQFNNSFGHHAGDALLRALGEALNAEIRGGDFACRYGGEEFVVVMPEAPLEPATRRANDIRERIAGLTVRVDGQSLGRITASIGVAAYPQHGATADSLVKQADRALYVAKGSGRDGVATPPER
jgi:diguanylate cyclase (GGDEF)-like protein/PAS domain S-box-containing protein